MISIAQLGAGILGMVVAVNRSYPYDFLFLHGKADRVARDTVMMGTAFSAPLYMLGDQVLATARLLRSPHDGSAAREAEGTKECDRGGAP